MEQFAKQNSGNADATYYPKGELVILRDSLKNFQLAWKFTISTLEPNDELLVVINAITGSIIAKRTLIMDNNAACVAQTMYSSNQNITGDTYTGGIRLREVRNGINVQTLNLNHTYNYTTATDFTNTNTNWTTGNWANINQDKAALDVHWAAEKVIDFWNSTFSRNSIDGAGIRVLSYVHAGNQYDNAAWIPGINNRFMQYGDGDGTITGPIVALDICGHEFGHGVNEFTSNLGTLYQDQEEDALNEGLSDIWGACIKSFAAPTKPLWLSGGEVLLTSTFNCVRNLLDPKSALASEGKHPNTYLKQYWSSNGESHTNSTVLSHWFYLLVQGGSGTNDNNIAYSVSGIGIAKAQQIVYRAEAHYLHAGDEYTDARTAMISAATDLYCANSPEVIAVTNAWYAVGVGAAYSGNAMSVSGLSSFCTTATYTAINQPTGVTSLVWSTSNSGIASINSATGLATKTGDGAVNMQATVTGAGGCATTVAKSVTVGNPLAGNISLWNSAGSTTIGNPVGFVAGYPPMNRCQITAADWQVTSVSANILHGDYECAGENGTSKNIFFQSTGTAYVQARVENACGWSGWSGPVPIQVSSGYFYMIAPNPATSTATIMQKDNSNADITEIKVFDNTGNLKKRSKYAAGTKQAQINVSDLKTGIYFIEISSGQNKERQQLVIQN